MSKFGVTNMRNGHKLDFNPNSDLSQYRLWAMGSEMDFNGHGSVRSACTAEWKRTQEQTFTRWVNQHLARVGKSIVSLRTDFSDGLALIALLEVLSGKKMPKYQQRPMLRSHKMDNVTLALRFLEQEEGIRVVNIGAADIVDSKLKLILGLIWHLILHYSISKPNQDHGEDDDDDLESNRSAGDSVTLTARQRLLEWLRNRMPGAKLSNFTSDWSDGRNLGYLVSSFEPTLCMDWYNWNPRNAEHNVSRAMDTAETHLGIQHLIEPEDVVSPDVDEPSMMTYLAQFRNAKVRRASPKPPTLPPPPPPPLLVQAQESTPPRAPAGSESVKGNSPKSTAVRKCKAFGQGLEFGTAGEQNRFVVDTRPAAATAVASSSRHASGNDSGVRLGLAVEGPSETQLTCTDNHDGFWTIDYKPDDPGEYTISVRLNDEHVEGSPFKVQVGSPMDKNNRNYNDSLAVTNCNCKHCQKLNYANRGSNNIEQEDRQRPRPSSSHSKKRSEAKPKHASGHKGQPFSVSIVGKNSPQYAKDEDQSTRGRDHQQHTETVIFEDKVDSPDSNKASSGATHEVSVTTTIDLSNGKTKTTKTVRDRDTKDSKGQKKQKEQPRNKETSGDMVNTTRQRKYPPIPQEWLPRTGNGDVYTHDAYGERARGPIHDPENDYDMEIHKSGSGTPKVVVHGCPCKECRNRAHRSKVVIYTNGHGEIDASDRERGQGVNGVKSENMDEDEDKNRPYRETVVSSTIEIHNPQDSCHIM